MFIAWSTVGNRTDADKLAKEIVSLGLAACVQIDGPVSSYYRWQRQLERSEEFRLCFKCTDSQLTALETYVLGHHPYETPEWIVVPASRVSEKYLSWAESNPTNLPL
jgi:periplasmic divalent cation tolerance protein